MLAAPRYGSVRKNSCLCVARILSYCYHCFLCDCLFFRASRGHQSRILILFLHFFAVCGRWRSSNWWLHAYIYSDRSWLPWHDREEVFFWEDINAWWERRLICIKNCGPFLIFLLAPVVQFAYWLICIKNCGTIFSGFLQYSHSWFYMDLEMLLACTFDSYWILYSFSWYDMIVG